MPSISPETVSPKLGNTKKTLDDCNGMKNNMPTILPETVSPKLGNTKKTLDDCNGMKNNMPTFLPGTVSPKLGNTKKTLDDCNGLKNIMPIVRPRTVSPKLVSENLDVASYIQSKSTKSHSNLVVEPTGFNQDEIRAKKYLKPRHGNNFPEKQTWDNTLVEEDVDNSLTNPVCAEIPHVIDKTKSGRNIKDVGDSLTDPVADDAPHGKEETHDGRNRKDVDNSLTIHVAGDVPHRKEETNDGRNRKDGCFVRLIGVIYLLLYVLSYQKKLFGKCTKSCKGVQKNKGIAVICFSLMIGFGGGASSSNGVCSVSSHLEGIPSESLEVGKDMKLICRHNCSKGTPRWDQDKPRGRELTYNGNVLTPNKQKIELEIIENEYNIIFLNATFADINSTYTCHYGFDWTHISPINYYKVLPTDASINKQSVYESNVLNGTLEFREVYPLPECVRYCDDKRQKKIPICKTCKIWKRHFYKVKLIFNIALNNTICREENVSVRCAVGRDNFTYDFSKLPKRKKYNKETTGICIGVSIGVLVGLSVLGILYKRGAFRRCRRDGVYHQNETDQLPYCVNDSQNNSQEEHTLLSEETLNMSGTSDTNEQRSEQCCLVIETSGETKNDNRETLNQTMHEQHEMHSDCLTNSDPVEENTITRPVVKNEGTPVQSGHNAVNRCEECNDTGQMPKSPGDVTLPEHYAKRKLEDQYTMANGSELNYAKSKRDNSLGNTNVKASKQMSTSDVPHLHEESSFSGDLAGIDKRNVEEE